jgi:hypothetical protein
MLHLLSKGRFVLGVGMGYRAEEYEAFGLRPASKGTRYERGLRELTSLLSPEHAARDGGALPVEPWARPPVWAGGWGPENLRRAVTYADACIPGPTADMEKLLECREIYHRHLREAPLTRELIVAPTEREAWDAAEAYLLPMYRDEYGSAWGHGLVDPERARELGEIGRNRFIIGSPDQVIAQTRHVAGEFGCAHIIYRLYEPRTPTPSSSRRSSSWGGRSRPPSGKGRAPQAVHGAGAHRRNPLRATVGFGGSASGVRPRTRSVRAAAASADGIPVVRSVCVRQAAESAPPTVSFVNVRRDSRPRGGGGPRP